MHDPDFHAALQRYARLRRVVYTVASANPVLRRRIDAPFRFADIDRATLDAWRGTWVHAHPFGYGGWDWGEIVRPLWRRPAGFALAIWSGEELCGMLSGRVSPRRPSGYRHTLSLGYLDGNPDRTHPLRGHVANLALGVAESYAQALELSRIRLIGPLPGVLRIYERLGYETVRSRAIPVYSEKTIRSL